MTYMFRMNRGDWVLNEVMAFAVSITLIIALLVW